MLFTAAVGETGPLSEAERVAQIHRLRDTIHKLPAAEAARRFAELTVRGTPPPRQQQIDHFVVLCEPMRVCCNSLSQHPSAESCLERDF